MSIVITQEIFIERCKEAHKEKYSYEKAVYSGNSKKVVITCKTHGDFLQTPAKHWAGRGCPECKKVKIGSALKNTKENVIESFRVIHGDKYNYGLVDYINLDTKVEIVCKDHGSFLQTPANHRKGKGCPLCARSRVSKTKTIGKDVWLKRFKEAHGDKYDYRDFSPINGDTPTEIFCREHGVFMQSPYSHASGKGCPLCGKNKTLDRLMKSQTQAEEEIKTKWGDKFTYPNFVYRGGDCSMDVVCNTHGKFTTTFNKHIKGVGCPICKIKTKKTIQTTPWDPTSPRIEKEEILCRFRSAHGDKYTYNFMSYGGVSDKVEITCKKHGVFRQTVHNHLLSGGCPSCVNEEISKRMVALEEDVISRFISVHGGRYDYKLVDYKRSNRKVKIVCEKHGVFEQIPEVHYRGGGCPKCTHKVSNQEQEVYEFIKEACPDAVQSDHTVLGKRELDIFVPSKNLAVEFNGVYWHSDKIKEKKYHYNKYKDCKNKGVRLIQFTDVDWEEKKDNMKSIILHALGKSVEDKGKVNARQCDIVDLSAKETKEFYNKNHPQGHASNRVNFGLKTKSGELVAVMSFGFGKTSRGSASKTATWELSRYATSCIVRGGASKLFKHFVREYRPEEVKSFSMNDWFSGGLYEVLGFIPEEVPPDYRVWHPKLGISPKSHWQRRSIPKRLLEMGSSVSFDPSTDKRTEWKLEDEVGAFRVWDSGKTRWVWRCSQDE